MRLLAKSILFFGSILLLNGCVHPHRLYNRGHNDSHYYRSHYDNNRYHDTHRTEYHDDRHHNKRRH